MQQDDLKRKKNTHYITPQTLIVILFQSPHIVHFSAGAVRGYRPDYFSIFFFFSMISSPGVCMPLPDNMHLRRAYLMPNNIYIIMCACARDVQLGDTRSYVSIEIWRLGGTGVGEIKDKRRMDAKGEGKKVKKKK